MSKKEHKKDSSLNEQEIKNISDDEIDLYELYLILMKRKNLFLAIFAFFFIISISLTFLYPSRYDYTIALTIEEKMDVNINKNVIINSSELISNLNLVKNQLLNNLKKEYPEVKDIEFKNLKNPLADKLLVQVTISQKQNEEILKKIFSRLVALVDQLPEIKELIDSENQNRKFIYENLINNLNTYERISQIIKENILNNKQMRIGFNIVGIVELDRHILELKTKKEIFDLQAKKHLDSLFKETSSSDYTYQAKPNRLFIFLASLVVSIFIAVFFVFFWEYIENQKKKSSL